MNEIQEVILFCLQDSPPDSTQTFLAQATDPQWGELVVTARKLGLAPLLYSRLRQLGIRIPSAVDELLRKDLLNNTARNINLLYEHKKLVEALGAQDIPVISLKGTYLAACIYRNIGERVIGDIDLLVPLDDLHRAVGAVESAGYRTRRKYDFELELRIGHHMPAYFKPNASPLEIHWNILAPNRTHHHVDLDGIWKRSLPVQIGECNTRTFCAEDLLLHLCVHIAYHHVNGVYAGIIRSLYDIKLVIKHFGPRLDWQIFSERALEWRLVNGVCLALQLTRSLLNLELPAHIWQSLQPAGFDEKMTAAAVSKIFREEQPSAMLISIWKGDDVMARLLGAWKRLALPPKILAGKYNLPPESKLVYLYYFIRIKDMLVHHGRDLTDLLLRNKRKSDILSNDGLLIDFLDWHPDR